MNRIYNYGYGFGLAFDAKLATDPPVSEPQRRAMFAARAGKSTLGIPKKVGEEFVGKAKDAKVPFEEWMKQVDAAVRAKTGLSYEDLDDYGYRDAYDRGQSPQGVASKAIKNAGG